MLEGCYGLMKDAGVRRDHPVPGIERRQQEKETVQLFVTEGLGESMKYGAN